MRVWIDQDLCTGDGLCTDHCPDVFVLLEDGISYVRDDHGLVAVPGGRACITPVPARAEDAVIAAAMDCPGECIFVEPDSEPPAHENDDDVEPADVIADRSGPSSSRGGA